MHGGSGGLYARLGTYETCTNTTPPSSAVAATVVCIFKGRCVTARRTGQIATHTTHHQPPPPPPPTQQRRPGNHIDAVHFPTRLNVQDTARRVALSRNLEIRADSCVSRRGASSRVHARCRLCRRRPHLRARRRLAQKQTSPVTSECLAHTNLTPNHQPKAQIGAWRETQQDDAGSRRS